MKILFWILVILSIPVGFYMTVIGYFANGLDLYSTGIGQVICILSMLSVAVSIVCAVLGIIKLRKGNVKKAVLFALAGVAYSAIILAGIFIDEAVGSMLMTRDIAKRNEQLYGEGWDGPSAMEGIPEHYETLLNEFYAVVRDKMTDNLMDLGAVSMEKHYGEAPLDNIGFVLMDVNSDGVDELVIGTAAPVEAGGTAIFCIYSDPENPFYAVNSVEGDTYYLHSGEAEGSYLAEIEGRDAAWLLKAEEGTQLVDIIYQEGALDPAGRLTLEMIPFSQYK